MRVRILYSAHNDKLDGYWFYENQESGVDDYFNDTLYGKIAVSPPATRRFTNGC